MEELITVPKLFKNVLDTNKPELLILIGYQSAFAGYYLLK